MNQYNALEKEILPFKKYVFKYWDKHGGGQFKTIMSLLLKSFEKKNFVGQGGSYNFNFYITNSRLYDEKEEYPEVYFDAIVDGMGEVDITTDDGEVYDRISQAILDDDIGWEVDEEIKDVMQETLEKILPEGLTFHFDTMDVRNNYPSNLR